MGAGIKRDQQINERLQFSKIEHFTQVIVFLSTLKTRSPKCYS